MAKTKSIKRSGGKAKRIVACVLALGVVTAGVCCTGYATRDDGGKWFGAWHWSDKLPDTGEGDKDGDVVAYAGGMLVTASADEAQPLKVVQAKVLSAGEGEETSKSVMLTAVIGPSNVSSTRVKWTVEFANSKSSWASGKAVTDYVTVTPILDGALTAQVDCLQEFGEPINVIVSTTDGSNLSATCVCDYVKRIEKVDLTVDKSYMSDDLSFDTATSPKPFMLKLYPYVGSTGQKSISTHITYGVGTIEEDVKVTVTCSLSDNYYAYMAAHSYAISEHYSTVLRNTFPNDASACRSMFGSNFFSNVDYANTVITSIRHFGPVFTIEAVGEHNNYSVSYNTEVNTSEMTVKADDIDIDGNIKF